MGDDVVNSNSIGTHLFGHWSRVKQLLSCFKNHAECPLFVSFASLPVCSTWYACALHLIALLRLLCRLGAHYDIEGVADSAVLVLAKFTSSLNPSIPKPRVAFGRDPKACAAVETMLLMVNRCVPGDIMHVLQDLLLST